MYLFNFLYFIVPVLLVLLWLLIINSRAGLKKRYLEDGWPLQKKILFGILLLIALLALAGFFMFCNVIFLMLSLTLFFLIVALARESFKNAALDIDENKKRLSQAKKQFRFAFILLAALLLIYFSCQILSYKKEHFEINSDWRESFPDKIFIAAKDREQLRKLDDLIDNIPNFFPSFPYVEKDVKNSLDSLREYLGIPLDTSKTKSIIGKTLYDSVHYGYPKKSAILIYAILYNRIKKHDSFLQVSSDSLKVLGRAGSKKQQEKIKKSITEVETQQANELTKQAHTLKLLISFHQKQSGKISKIIKKMVGNFSIQRALALQFNNPLSAGDLV